MKNKKLKAMALFVTVFAFFAGAVFVSTGALKAADPSGVHVTVFQTDLFSDASGTAVTVYTSSSGKTVDIVGNPDVFGAGTVNAGTYKRIHFVVQNQVSFTGANPDPAGLCSGLTPTVDGTFLIDDAKAATDQVDLYFATSDDGGSSGWIANGTSAHPFLIQSPVTVEANANTVVKLIFNTAGTLICSAADTVTVNPPTMTALNYVEQAPIAAGYCGSLGEYWLAGYRLYSYPTGSNGNLIANPTLGQVLSAAHVTSWWGTVTFGAPSGTGAGTWSIDQTKGYDQGGQSEHSHNLHGWYDFMSDNGYIYNDPDGSLIQGSYILNGSKFIMNDVYVEGAMSDDCSTFVAVKMTTSDSNELIFGVKKGTYSGSYTWPLNSKVVAIGPELSISYPFSTPTATNSTRGFNYGPGWAAFDVRSGADAVQLEWKNSHEMHPDFENNTWSVSPPSEIVYLNSIGGMTTFPLTGSEGLIDNPTDFLALGANGNIIGAGEVQEMNNNWNNHRLAFSMFVETPAAPMLADVVGKWMIGELDSKVSAGSDGAWHTTDDQVSFGITYGDIMISLDSSTGKYRGCGGFVHKDILSGTMASSSSNCVTIELHNDCLSYNDATNTGLPVTDTACAGGFVLPVFYAINDDGTLNGKFVLDKSKKTLITWASFDTDGKPCMDPSSLTSISCDASPRSMAGVGVKAQ